MERQSGLSETFAILCYYLYAQQSGLEMEILRKRITNRKYGDTTATNHPSSMNTKVTETPSDKLLTEYDISCPESDNLLKDSDEKFQEPKTRKLKTLTEKPLLQLANTGTNLNRRYQIEQIIMKGKKLDIDTSELRDMFYFTPFYFSLLRVVPCFGLELRRKHNRLDSIVTPLHSFLMRVVNRTQDILKAMFASKIYMSFLLLFILLASLAGKMFYDSYENNCIEATFRGLDEIFSEGLRPQMPCSVCSQLSSVPEVTNISREEFKQKYAFTGVPVVVRGAAAMVNSNISFNHFRSEYKKNQQALEDIDEECQFLEYMTKFETLAQVFKMSSKRAKLMKGEKPWYIGWSSCTDASRSVTQKIYKTPEFLPPLESQERKDWVFMGGAGHGAHIHIDDIYLPSWQAQLSGRKTWRLIPSYECESVCNSLEVTVNTGDIISVDTHMWFHSTKILPGPISITIGSEYA